jgi:hypothetical protein
MFLKLRTTRERSPCLVLAKCLEFDACHAWHRHIEQQNSVSLPVDDGKSSAGAACVSTVGRGEHAPQHGADESVVLDHKGRGSSRACVLCGNDAGWNRADWGREIAMLRGDTERGTCCEKSHELRQRRSLAT